MPYFVYILTCADGTFYIGSTTDLSRRVREHNESLRGAKYTKVRRPVTISYSEMLSDRSAAQKREYVLKQLTRAEKSDLIIKISNRKS